MNIKVPDVDIIINDNNQYNQCNHKYLNKWVDKYYCMSCPYILNDNNDIERIKLEKRLEEITDQANAEDISSKSDDDIGKKSQERGISIRFLLEFTRKYQCWDWNSWDVIKNIIKPATEARRCRFVELDDMKDNFGPAHTFISYAQAGKWGDLVAAILDGDADLNRYIWLDVFSVRQWPSKIPDLDFKYTIKHCGSFIAVCSNTNSISNDDDKKKIIFLRIWCLVELHAAAVNEIPIIFKCGAYHINEKCNFEFKSNFEMLSLLYDKIDINNADATVKSDKTRILNDIESEFGIEKLNKVVRGVLKAGLAFNSYPDMNRTAQYIQNAACGDQVAKSIVFQDLSNNLRIASIGGYVRIVEELLQKGADVNHKCQIGTTALMRAARAGHLRVLELLLKYQADVNIKTIDSHTALMRYTLKSILFIIIITNHFT